MVDNRLGSWAFIIGLILAVVLGLGFGDKYAATLIWALFFIGIIVGLLNITAHETQAFLTAGTVLALVSFLGITVGIFDAVLPVKNVLLGILTLFVPSTIIVALKDVYELARE